MPCAGIDMTAYLREKSARVKAKLARLGINPRSNKYNKLFFRMMGKP